MSSQASPKAALQVGGKPMAARVIEAMRGGGVERIIVVIGHRAEDVQTAIGNHVEYVEQKELLGTGHAVQQAEQALSGYSGPVVVTYADVPLLRSKDIAQLVARHRETGAAATLLTAIFEDPGLKGRILRRPDRSVAGIVEARDATPEQLAIREINAGIYCFETPLLFEVLRQVKNDNAQHQYYLTDAIGILVEQQRRVEAVAMEFAFAGLGVDTPDDLAHAQRLLLLSEA
jgi:bifunctional UDP-N-acetylglucosamine pyrophosphorylase/glucosamine-1-phosphate N-acetyltransferase